MKCVMLTTTMIMMMMTKMMLLCKKINKHINEFVIPIVTNVIKSH